MIIYKDIFTNVELCSDTYSCDEEMEVLYCFQGSQVRKSDSGEYNIGASVDEEGEDREERGSLLVADIVDLYRLRSVSMDKRAYMEHIKDYMKRVLDRLNESDPERAEVFKRKASVASKYILDRIKDFEFLRGEEDQNHEGMVVLQFLKEDGITPYFYMWKDGLYGEKR
uniref:TCTP domain-containing protein n=1 Tax=Arcella intermedia TaxID=1963864 RepID=A0A6B2LMZ0_9EUKA|eukprot:TRINITY_DN9722_c0_g1_i1.p1 TRINITY_DN9722_c0_g1~~TRINITY_DN9722_c0_g1_i1.p1  ORF type:complete len:169 (-),score=31.89 TRINITY_DN9722_c0_g1_i1:44-550(-)